MKRKRKNPPVETGTDRRAREREQEDKREPKPPTAPDGISGDWR